MQCWALAQSPALLIWQSRQSPWQQRATTCMLTPCGHALRQVLLPTDVVLCVVPLDHVAHNELLIATWTGLISAQRTTCRLRICISYQHVGYGSVYHTKGLIWSIEVVSKFGLIWLGSVRTKWHAVQILCSPCYLAGCSSKGKSQPNVTARNACTGIAIEAMHSVQSSHQGLQMALSGGGAGPVPMSASRVLGFLLKRLGSSGQVCPSLVFGSTSF